MTKAVMLYWYCSQGQSVHPSDSLHLTTPHSHIGNFLDGALQPIPSPGAGGTHVPHTAYTRSKVWISMFSALVYLFFSLMLLSSFSNCFPVNFRLNNLLPPRCCRFTELLKHTGILRWWKQLQGVQTLIPLTSSNIWYFQPHRKSIQGAAGENFYVI